VAKPSKSEHVPVDEMQRILVEVGTGKKLAKPDAPEMAALRKEFEADFAKARANGTEIQIPSE
jgi:hypothetical protein